MNNLKILIAEDEAIVALEITTRLKLMGHNVCGTASSGEKAILLAGQTHPHLVLMDIKLKGEMDGIEAAEIIKEKFSIPSIFLTALSDESTLRQIKKTSNKEILMKPFQEIDLKNSIEKLINISNLKQSE